MAQKFEKLVLENIRTILHLQDMTITELSNKIGRSPQNLSQKIAGERGLSLEELDLIADALECSPAEFMWPLKNLPQKEALEMIRIGRWLFERSVPVRRTIFKMGLAALNAQRKENYYAENPELRKFEAPDLLGI